jgi:hypothetical protein
MTDKDLAQKVDALASAHFGPDYVSCEVVSRAENDGELVWDITIYTSQPRTQTALMARLSITRAIHDLETDRHPFIQIKKG